MTTDANRELVLRFYEEVWNRGNVEVASEVFAEDYVRHDLRPSAGLPGPEGQAKIAADFRRAPCTRGGHHAYVGGLLEHTVAVGTLVGDVCQLHPRLDSDLLMAAALLHDVGKTREFTYGAEFGITEEGRLIGHLALGTEIIGSAGGGLSSERRTALLHCVLSHHGGEGGRSGTGARGFGNPEALALYRLNALDAGVKGALEHGLQARP